LGYFFVENGSVYEVKWKNVVEPGRPRMTIWRMRIACWIYKYTNTHSEYVIVFTFSLQQWLPEEATVLRFTYIAYPAASEFARQNVKVLCITHFSSQFLCASDSFFS
jgi:hypothetical protein